jgi:hypothetical protein
VELGSAPTAAPKMNADEHGGAAIAAFYPAPEG